MGNSEGIEDAEMLRKEGIQGVEATAYSVSGY